MFRMMCVNVAAAEDEAKGFGFVKQANGAWVRDTFGKIHIATFHVQGKKCLLMFPK